MLEREFAVFNLRRDEFLRTHAGEYVVIQGESVLGFFKTEIQALENMRERKLGSFLVKKCETVDDETARYASRVVAFA